MYRYKLDFIWQTPLLFKLSRMAFLKVIMLFRLIWFFPWVQIRMRTIEMLYRELHLDAYNVNCTLCWSTKGGIYLYWKTKADIWRKTLLSLWTNSIFIILCLRSIPRWNKRVTFNEQTCRNLYHLPQGMHWRKITELKEYHKLHVWTLKDTCMNKHSIQVA